MKQNFNSLSLSDNFFSNLTNVIKSLGFSWTDKKLHEAIIELSNHFQNKDDRQTLWHSKDYQAAYLAYFHPLNTLRIKSLNHEISQLFKKQTEIVDFGSGPGTFEQALFYELKFPFKQITCIESDRYALGIHKKLHLNSKPKSHSPPPSHHLSWSNIEETNLEGKLLTMSYSFNEANKLISWVTKADQIIIIDPSTQNHGRNLMQLRETLIREGFEILAPCTQQGQCPLLKHSKKDWCHTRVHIKMPPYWREMERQLPMTNNSLTFSYLVASKKVKNKNSGKARVIGDTLKEKGKTKQAICQNEEREFISWLNKDKKNHFFQRGELITLTEDVLKKGNELRLI